MDILQKEIILNDGSKGILIDSKKTKAFRSKNYNFTFNKKSGFFARWGSSLEDDGDLNLGLPEIADIEISTICSGINNKPCSFCYKGNTSNGVNMTLETFIKLFDKLKFSITQIAFGIGDIDSNPDMFDIFWHCRNNGVIPNVTINGWNLTDEYAKKLSEVCGAVAVSMYDYDLCANAVKKLTDLGMTQINIHNFIANNTLDRTWHLIKNVKSDERFVKLNAIVMLSLKKQGRAKTGFDRVSDEDFKELALYALDNNIGIGFDSCSAAKFIKAVKDTEYYDRVKDMIEGCESSVYSCYVNTYGFYFPCSFMEDTIGWEEGLNVLECNDFLKDIWWNPKTLAFKKSVIHCRNCEIGCPVYDI